LYDCNNIIQLLIISLLLLCYSICWYSINSGWECLFRTETRRENLEEFCNQESPQSISGFQVSEAALNHRISMILVGLSLVFLEYLIMLSTTRAVLGKQYTLSSLYLCLFLGNDRIWACICRGFSVLGWQELNYTRYRCNQAWMRSQWRRGRI